jgi:hypothetical protein
MNLKLILVGSALAAALPVVAQDASKNRVSFGYRATFLIDAEFNHRGSAPVGGGPSLGGSYSDGYVRTDSTGNAGGLTTNWGYQSADQVSDGSLFLRGSQDGSLGSDTGSDFNHGFELLYGRYVGTLGKGRWGIDFGFNLTAVDIGAAYSAPRGVLFADGFALGGIVPPLAPYNGPFTAGPGVPLLPATGTATPVIVANQLDSTLYGFKVGPFWEVPLSDRITFGVGVGFTLVVADTDYSFTDTYGGIQRRGSASRTEALPGGYASATLAFRLTEHCSVEAGMQLQGADSARLQTAEREVEMKLGFNLMTTLGIRWEF